MPNIFKIKQQMQRVRIKYMFNHIVITAGEEAGYKNN